MLEQRHHFILLLSSYPSFKHVEKPNGPDPGRSKYLFTSASKETGCGETSGHEWSTWERLLLSSCRQSAANGCSSRAREDGNVLVLQGPDTHPGSGGTGLSRTGLSRTGLSRTGLSRTGLSGTTEQQPHHLLFPHAHTPPEDILWRVLHRPRPNSQGAGLGL